jgi:predicted RNA binding protein YcfA (HicA-like mRNA interferase family)
MSRFEKLLLKILTGMHDKNIDFDELRGLLQKLGFFERVKGDHHIFIREDVIEIINIKPQGKLAKPYQVKQVRNLIIRYKPGGENGEI